MELLFHSALISRVTVKQPFGSCLGDSTELLLQSHSVSSPFRYSGFGGLNTFSTPHRLGFLTKIACLFSSQNSLQISSSPNQASVRPSSSSPQIL
ncbi:hypothetical protein ES332_A12G146200v1 [Gossypium tomentosum]|uniref:Uncharacterized protein n=1 Tax=Gossypium tomentosum TaxID=34277 RepID=A0A5D2MWP0_GOSTO|nr:hypothetical protein ES332_A12G146200v1 [Gossypium tomentosum]